MSFLIKVGTRYYFNRRVPADIQEYDPRPLIRVSLKTDSRTEAKRKAIILNEQIESYWKSLIETRQTHTGKGFKQAVRVARQMGFSYQPMSVVSALPIMELLERIFTLQQATPNQIEAVLGGRSEPEITVLDALDLFWGLSKDKIINKSEFQIRKWKNPRKKAVENFVALRGNKKTEEINKDDIIAFRDWWIDRIKNENKNADTANKNLLHLKVVLQTVSDHLKLQLDIEHLFKKVLLKVRFTQTRLPFTSEQIITILESGKLENTHPEKKWFLHMMAETGARPCELVNLLPEDIKLDAEIPHICIVDRENNPLKTDHSSREIPLVGYALEAFKNMPNGFFRYRDKSDILVTAVNKFLRYNKLVPPKRYTVYSLRHSFQDRILRINTPDRVQADLMGHKFIREAYGNGSPLDQKLEFLIKACLKKTL